MWERPGIGIGILIASLSESYFTGFETLEKLTANTLFTVKATDVEFSGGVVV